MKTIFIAIFLSILISGCIGHKELSKSQTKKESITKEMFIEETSDITAEAKLSAPTKLFIQKLNEEKNIINIAFQPSEGLIEDYNLQKIENAYYIGGLIRVREIVNEEKINELGVNIGTKAGNIWTVRIPILKIEELKSITGIDYIQIDEPIKLK